MSQLLVVCASHAPGMARDSRALSGTSFRAGMAELQRRVAAFAPELVVVFGGDHRRAFREVTPAFTVVQNGELLADAGHPGSELHVPTALALDLTDFLLARDFDVAAGRNLQLDHAFSQPLEQLAGLGVIFQRSMGGRAHQDLEQFGVDAGATGRGGFVSRHRPSL